MSSDALKTKFYESFNSETQPSVGKKCYALMFGKQKEIFSPGWQDRCTRVVKCGPSVLLHHILASCERHIYYGAAAQRSPGIIRAALSIGEIKFTHYNYNYSIINIRVIHFNVYNPANMFFSSFVTPPPHLLMCTSYFSKMKLKQYAVAARMLTKCTHVASSSGTYMYYTMKQH